MTVANAVSRPDRSAPPGRMDDFCDDASSLCESKCLPEGKTQGLTKGGPVPKRDPFNFPLRPQPSGNRLGSTLHTREENTAHHACEWTGRNVLCYPSKRKIDPRTLQPRHRAMHILPDARRRTSNSTEMPKIILTMSLGAFCGPKKGLVIAMPTDE